MNLIMALVCVVFSILCVYVVVFFWRMGLVLLAATFALTGASIALYSVYYVAPKPYEALARFAEGFSQVSLSLLAVSLLWYGVRYLRHRRQTNDRIAATRMKYLANASKRRAAKVKVARAPSHLATSPPAIISSQDDELLAHIHEAEQRPQRVIEG